MRDAHDSAGCSLTGDATVRAAVVKEVSRWELSLEHLGEASALVSLQGERRRRSSKHFLRSLLAPRADSTMLVGGLSNKGSYRKFTARRARLAGSSPTADANCALITVVDDAWIAGCARSGRHGVLTSEPRQSLGRRNPTDLGHVALRGGTSLDHQACHPSGPWDCAQTLRQRCPRRPELLAKCPSDAPRRWHQRSSS